MGVDIMGTGKKGPTAQQKRAELVETTAVREAQLRYWRAVIDEYPQALAKAEADVAAAVAARDRVIADYQQAPAKIEAIQAAHSGVQLEMRKLSKAALINRLNSLRQQILATEREVAACS